MKIVYMGTPEFAVPTLEALIKSRHDVVAVCTQPDRPAGRGHKMAQSPVKVKALEYGIPVFQPETLRLPRKGKPDPYHSATDCPETILNCDLRATKDDRPCERSCKFDTSSVDCTRSPADSRTVRNQLKILDADIFVVAAYGLLLPKGVLEMPRFGCINVHGSLLPKYRGASPIHAALLNGDNVTGITIMHMAKGIDTGDMIVKKELPIAPDERFPSLHDRMAMLGAEALLEAVELLESGTAPRIPQDDAFSTYAPMLKKTDAIIDWNQPTDVIINMTRALDPWPGSQTMYGGKPLKIWRLEAAAHHSSEIRHSGLDSASGAGQALGIRDGIEVIPGTVLAVDPTRGVLIKTGTTAAWATELQGDGSKRMPATDYLRGRKIEVGVILG